MHEAPMVHLHRRFLCAGYFVFYSWMRYEAAMPSIMKLDKGFGVAKTLWPDNCDCRLACPSFFEAERRVQLKQHLDHNLPLVLNNLSSCVGYPLDVRPLSTHKKRRKVSPPPLH
jgi:hypothetical protein